MEEMGSINKILFITLSNIGDVILTLPVLDFLRANFPESEITIMVGPRAREIFEGNPNITRLIVYDKYSKFREKVRLFNELKKERFDIVVDLRNTLYGALLPARYRTSPLLFIPSHIRHMKERNLYRLQRALKIKKPLPIEIKKSFQFNPSDKDYAESLLKANGITTSDKIVVVSVGTGGGNRKWGEDKFAQLCLRLSDDYKVILIGTKTYQSITRYIYRNCQSKIYDFTGLTNLRQLAYLLARSKLLITCDTGTLQLGSYLDTPIVALFGPSEEKKYGPWSSRYRIITKEIFCRSCRKAQCRFATVECMELIKVVDVLRGIKDILDVREEPKSTMPKKYFRRILIVRTDRMGDVILSTPAIKALRDTYPQAYLAIMVSPYTKDLVEGNPHLDEVIIYDKDSRHKSWWRSLKFALKLKKKRFDLAVILHPTNRVHLVTFFAGITRRIGYARKLGFLLTDRIQHAKQYGEKHELEYNLDLIRYLGIQPKEKNLFVPLRPDSESWAEEFLREKGVGQNDKLLAIHPAASCPSKIWPAERFAEASNRLTEKYGFKVVVVSGPGDWKITENVIGRMRGSVINLAGRISLSQLASILKRCILFISNDSGPVHLASAVGTPVISIFGRNQKGLSPQRWGPLGLKDGFLHKEIGCIVCLAHACDKEFACLKAITVDEVMRTAERILSGEKINKNRHDEIKLI